MAASLGRAAIFLYAGVAELMTSESIIAITLLTASALTSGFFRLHAQLAAPGLLDALERWLVPARAALPQPRSRTWVAVATWQSAVNDGCWPRRRCYFSAQRESIRRLLRSSPANCRWCGVRGLVRRLLHAQRKHFAATRRGRGALLRCLGLYQESRRHETFADLLLAVSFLSWGAILVGELLLTRRLSDSLRAMEILPQLFAAALMVMGLYEEESAASNTTCSRFPM